MEADDCNGEKQNHPARAVKDLQVFGKQHLAADEKPLAEKCA
jgi:hypothetical protein